MSNAIQRILAKRNILIIVVWLLLLGFIFSFSRKDTSQEMITTTEKQKFFIDTLSLWTSTTGAAMMMKTGKIAWSSEVVVTAQVPWRVQKLYRMLGDMVTPETLLLQLDDTNGSYSYATQRAGLSVNSAKNSYQQQIENLEKQIQDATIAYERAKLQSTTAADDALKQLEKAKYDLTNVSQQSGSSSSLQIAKLEKDLEKAQFDYETKLKADEQSLVNFVATAKNIHNDIALLIQDVLFETDKILWISDTNRYLNDAYENALSATNTSYLTSAKDLYDRLDEQRKRLESYDAATITIENIQTKLFEYQSFLDPTNALLKAMEQVLTNTSAGWSISQLQLDWLKAQFDGYQSKAQWTVASITAQLNAIQSFLSTYKQQQQSLAKSVDLLNDQIQLTKKSLQDAAFNTQIGSDRTQIGVTNSTQNAALSVESAQSALDFVLNTKNLSLQSIENARKQAEVSYAEANAQLAKFSVKAPIAGKISDVFVDLWQEVSPWTQLYKIVSDQQEIEINVLPSEYDLLILWQEVMIQGDDGTQVMGTLVSKSDAGDRNGNFKALIQVSENRLKVWTYADIYIPVWWKTTGVPINAVRIVDNGVGEIFLRDGSEVIKKTVALWQLLGSQIEIKTQLPTNMKLILTNIERYDPNLQQIVEKNKN